MKILKLKNSIFLLTPLIIFNKQLMGKFLNIFYKVAAIAKVIDKLEERFEDFYFCVSKNIFSFFFDEQKKLRKKLDH